MTAKTHRIQIATGALRASILAAAVSGAALIPATAAQAAPSVLAPENAPTRVAAWESTVMWSRQDPASGRYELMKSVAGGPPTAVGVPKRSGTPFDVDLGTSSSGATFAVYTRNGDIYRLNVATGVEAKVRRLSSPKVERSPTIQRGRIAFIRRSGRVDELRIGTATTAGRVLVRSGSIEHAELGDRHVAYVTGALDRGVYERRMHIRNIATRADKVVYRARSGGSNNASIFRASYMDKPEGFLWARTNVGSNEASSLIRYTLRDSRLGYAPGSKSHISTAWAGAALGAVTTGVIGGAESMQSTNPAACTDGSTGDRYCDVLLTGPLTFAAKP
jgi:hypothetical protein